MGHSVSLAQAVAGLLLLPGDLACNAMGVGGAGYRDLFRMLINSLVWTAVGAVVVVFAV